MLSELELELFSVAASMLALLAVLLLTRPPKAPAGDAPAGGPAKPDAAEGSATGAGSGTGSAAAGSATPAGAELAELCTQLGAQVQKLRLRVHELEHLVDGLREGPVGRVEAAPDPALARATELARGGASADQLMGDCRLSRGEAELLARLHGTQSTAA